MGEKKEKNQRKGGGEKKRKKTSQSQILLAITNFTTSRASVAQVVKGEGLLVPRSSVRFRLNPENSNSYGFELHIIKGTKLLLKVIKAIIIINKFMPAYFHVHAEIDSVESMTMTLHASLARDAEHCNIGIKMAQWLMAQCSI